MDAHIKCPKCNSIFVSESSPLSKFTNKEGNFIKHYYECEKCSENFSVDTKDVYTILDFLIGQARRAVFGIFALSFAFLIISFCIPTIWGLLSIGIGIFVVAIVKIATLKLKCPKCDASLTFAATELASIGLERRKINYCPCCGLSLHDEFKTENINKNSRMPQYFLSAKMPKLIIVLFVFVTITVIFWKDHLL
ncbi:hypothetical protein [Agitococcus lubricus]|uniref:Uncharacterized protein n=1 Tax=Agitococcus lubricus TaxID=1077255 RepID=A0A2T5ITK7_9GAMM|nr:hypothetical protein [Agitococcus lubricus]PTQ87202.1 hypothetical protein C8N29_1205 [Agitococcus lubricus]